MRNALNEVMREAYQEDNQRGVDKWNKILAEEGIDFQLRLPSRVFHRQIGIYADGHYTPEGEAISLEDWQRRRDEWLPSESDRAYIASIMQPVHEPGKIANWIAPPSRGINQKPLDYEYVRLDPK